MLLSLVVPIQGTILRFIDPCTEMGRSLQKYAVDDVVLIKYSSKSASGTYRLGRVMQVKLDEDNLDRTCVVKYRLIKSITDANRQAVDDIVFKEIRVPVQRLVLIIPVEEQS